MKKMPSVLMFLVLVLVVLNIVILRELSSVEARLERLEKQPNAPKAKP